MIGNLLAGCPRMTGSWETQAAECIIEATGGEGKVCELRVLPVLPARLAVTADS